MKVKPPTTFWRGLTLEQGLLGLVVVLVGVTEALGGGAVFDRSVAWIAQPTLVVSRWWASLMIGPYDLVTTSWRAARRVQDLELKYAASQAELAELAALRTENEALKTMLDARGDKSGHPTVVTAPLVSLAEPAIAAGTQDGVQDGQLVLVAQNLVGFVKQAGPYQSEVSLLSQPDGPLVVAVTQSGVEGLVKGDGRRLLLTEVPLDQQLTVGDKVVTVGQVGVPHQIFIGTIQSIKQDPASASQMAVIDQLVSFYQTDLVEVQSL